MCLSPGPFYVKALALSIPPASIPAPGFQEYISYGLRSGYSNFFLNNAVGLHVLKCEICQISEKWTIVSCNLYLEESWGMSVTLVPRLPGNTVPSSAEGFCWEDCKQIDGCPKGLWPPTLETQPVRAHRYQHCTENSHLETLWPQVGLQANFQGHRGRNPSRGEQKLANWFYERPNGQVIFPFDESCSCRGLKKILIVLKHFCTLQRLCKVLYCAHSYLCLPAALWGNWWVGFIPGCENQGSHIWSAQDHRRQ